MGFKAGIVRICPMIDMMSILIYIDYSTATRVGVRAKAILAPSRMRRAMQRLSKTGASTYSSTITVPVCSTPLTLWYILSATVSLEPFDDILRQGQYGKFKRMADAIANLSETTGEKSIIYSLCQWGRVSTYRVQTNSIFSNSTLQEQPWFWAREFGQSWRVSVPFDGVC